MIQNIQRIFIYLGLALSFILFMPAVSHAEETVQSAPAIGKENILLQKVIPSHVCMVTNRYFGKDQIPVDVNGQTYYGCCNMCKGTLTNKLESHYAIDPISGNKVDKAIATIGAAPDGSVHYFENEDNFKSFSLLQNDAK